MKAIGKTFLLTLAVAWTAAADSVCLVYRSAVADDYGNPLAACETNVVFRLYENAAGPTNEAVFASDDVKVKTDAAGVFQHTLNLSGCMDLVRSGRLNYVGVTVAGGEEIAPRQAILPQPYANRAATADRIGPGGQVAHLETGELVCAKRIVGAANVQVTVSECLAFERHDPDAALPVSLATDSLDITATDGMTVFTDGWKPLDATWWSANWSSLKRGKKPADGALALNRTGAYFFSSLGERAGADESAAQYDELLNLRNTIWRMPGVAFFGRKGDTVGDAFDKIFKPVSVEAGRNTDSFVPPQVRAAYLPTVLRLKEGEADE